MKRKWMFPAVSLFVLTACLRFGAARADTVLYDSTGLITGTQSFTQSFDLSGPGTLTVTLNPISWFDVLQNLNVLLSTPSGLISANLVDGVETVHFDGGQLFADWFGTANGAYKIGAYGLTISYRPDSVTPVPLPLSFVLLFSGLTLLLIHRRPARSPAERLFLG
ncbi:MAG: hypothetical protein KGL34_10795 [Gammaproteobacteria bacterium]|nr:hypothetical protein [Gammaproteobacteria bacterium]